jgi:hypothetical protein
MSERNIIREKYEEMRKNILTRADGSSLRSRLGKRATALAPSVEIAIRHVLLGNEISAKEFRQK